MKVMNGGFYDPGIMRGGEEKVKIPKNSPAEGCPAFESHMPSRRNPIRTENKIARSRRQIHFDWRRTWGPWKIGEDIVANIDRCGFPRDLEDFNLPSLALISLKNERVLVEIERTSTFATHSRIASVMNWTYHFKRVGAVGIENIAIDEIPTVIGQLA